MFKLNGKSVAPGIAQGEAYVFNPDNGIVQRKPIAEKNLDREVRQLHRAIEKTRRQLKKISGHLKEAMGSDSALIIGTQSQLLDEGILVKEVELQIRTNRINTEWAIREVEQKYTEIFSKIQDLTFRERVNDISDLLQRIVRNLTRNGAAPTPTLDNVILVARDIAPSEAAHIMSHGKLLGLVLSEGGETSHTVILARTQEIPAVMSVENAYEKIRTGDQLIVDGLNGEITVHPDNRTRQSYSVKREKYETHRERSRQVLKLPDQTLDGHDFHLSANIELPMEVDMLQPYGALGIGLFRTEFLLSDKRVVDSENEQYLIYKNIAQKIYPHSMILRTFDVGRDKHHETLGNLNEPNPALGTMAIRLFLREEALFKIQLKAAMRANESGNVRLLFPMVTEIEEIHTIRRLLDSCRSELAAEGIDTGKPIPIGIMLEIPGAVKLIPHLGDIVDFFSVGTNDLIQYLLAADRNNPSVSYLYNPFHPAVIRILMEIREEVARIGKEVNVCGEMAGQEFTALMLLGMGYTHLSMNPLSIVEIKRLFTHVHLNFIRRVVRHLPTFASRSDAEEYLIEKLLDRYPALFTQQALF